MFGIGNSVVVGYDISTKYAQISYMAKGDDMPKTISAKDGVEQFNIPVCLFKRLEVNQWFYGEDAISYSEMEEGQLVDNLWERALVGEKVVVVEEEFDPVALLLLYIKRSLTLILRDVKKDDIAGIMFTVPKLTKRAIEVLEQVVGMMNLGDTKIGFQGREESIYYYIVNQPEEMRKYGVMVYDYSEEYMMSLYYHENRNTSPTVAFVDELEHPQLSLGMEEQDGRFLEIVETTIGEKLISCAYLIGDGFGGDWCNESLKELCRNRRAFRGNNLYSRGACYAMRSRLEKTGSSQSRVFLGKDKLKANVGMDIRRGRDESYLALLNGGENWFDSKVSYEMILDKGNSFTLSIMPLDGREVRNVEIVLEGLEEREAMATRIKLEAIMESENMLRVNVTDLGFGEIYPATYQLFTKEIDINE